MVLLISAVFMVEAAVEVTVMPVEGLVIKEFPAIVVEGGIS